MLITKEFLITFLTVLLIVAVLGLILAHVLLKYVKLGLDKPRK